MGVSTRRTLRPSPKEVKAQAITARTPVKASSKSTKKIANKAAENGSKTQKIIQNLDDVISEFHDTNGELDHFFITNENECKRYKNITKHLYDHLQNKRNLFDTKFQSKLQKKETLKSLIVKDFDNEQIWQQLEMFNQPFLKNIVSDVASFLNKKAIITFNVDLGESRPKADNKKFEEKTNKRNTKYVFDDDSEEDMEELQDDHGDDFDDDDEDDVDAEMPSKKKNKKEQSKPKQNGKVDFFDLKEMEAYLDAEDEKEMNDQPEEVDDENDVDIDYFADIPSDDEEDEDGDDDMMYDDFFDPPSSKKEKKVVTFQEGKIVKDNKKKTVHDDDGDDDDDGEFADDEEDDEEGDDEEDEIDGLDTRDFDQEDGDENNEFDGEEDDEEMEELDDEQMKKNPRDIFANSSDDDEEEEEEDEVNKRLRNLAKQNFGEDSDDDLEGKSEFEKSQALLKRKIEKAQRELLQPAALNWKLAGEAICDARPENSLLEEHLDFDHVSRPAPIITDDTTKTLEDLIRQRIKDKAFDDVERKVKPKEQPFEFRRRLLIDSEKSKASLAEVYEQEFVKRQELAGQQQQQAGGFIAAGEAEESENRKQIRRMMKSLFRKLDALSAFHFTPRAPEPEVKIINNMPAISVEEATPDVGSMKSLVGPEEVFNTRNKMVLQAPGERQATDRKRARRIKKKKQGIKRKLEEAKSAAKSMKLKKAQEMDTK